MIVIGLTGSIGMGKSTTLELFRAEGCATWDADAAVHRLYAPGGAAVAAVEALFGGIVTDGAVDRERLAHRLAASPEGYARLEAVVHPLVAADRAAFLEQARSGGSAIAVVDVPLLFETGGDAHVDIVVTASAPAHIQRERVLARPNMTPERLDGILSRQTPDAEKRARSDFVIDTGQGLEAARRQVRAIIAQALARPLPMTGEQGE